MIAAVKHDYALIATAAGPYHEFSPDYGTGHPSGPTSKWPWTWGSTSTASGGSGTAMVDRPEDSSPAVTADVSRSYRDDGIPSRFFRLVHCRVCPAVISDTDSPERARGGPDAQGRVDDAPGVIDRFGGAAPGILGNGDHLIEVMDVEQQHQYLVPADPAHRVTDANTVANTRRDRSEHHVADRVPQGVVDGLELVDVAEQHAPGGAIQPGAGPAGRPRVG